ncbi:BON domain-containing protein [Brackiella oedipodis]|uniref:BON domain-containing protein n=1 Tax=Brackiella oedipodis TaxID=124225 RepID=UPI00048C0643|nr:BON domain-containing protein [Brackiella oedipodis]
MKPSSSLLPQRLPLALLLASLCLTNTACVPLFVGGAAAAGATVATDRRSSGMQLTDKSISIRVEHEVGSAFPSNTTRVNALTFNQRVLLTGEILDEASKTKAGQIARKSKDVREVLNQLKVGPVADFGSRSNDSWIASKVRTELIATKGVPSRTIALTVSKGVVYLMGQVNATEANLAAQAASRISGVKQVVKAFDIISNSATATSETTPATPSNESSQQAADSGYTQTYPLK